MDEQVNNKSIYQSEFFDGIYGIWLGDCNEWWIMDITAKGQCIGYARAKPNSTEECIENIGWIWDYSDTSHLTNLNSLMKANKGLGVKCIEN